MFKNEVRFSMTPCWLLLIIKFLLNIFIFMEKYLFTLKLKVNLSSLVPEYNWTNWLYIQDLTGVPYLRIICIE